MPAALDMPDGMLYPDDPVRMLNQPFLAVDNTTATLYSPAPFIWTDHTGSSERGPMVFQWSNPAPFRGCVPPFPPPPLPDRARLPPACLLSVLSILAG